MKVKTATVAGWSTQRVGNEKRRLINEARDMIAQQQRGEGPAPKYMDVPDRMVPRVGRPRITTDDLTQHPIYLTPDTLATARKLGDGNVSAGVRSALAMVCDAHAALAMADYDGASPDARAELVNQIAAAERALREGK